MLIHLIFRRCREFFYHIFILQNRFQLERLKSIFCQRSQISDGKKLKNTEFLNKRDEAKTIISISL